MSEGGNNVDNAAETVFTKDMTSTHTSTAPTTLTATQVGALAGFESHCTCGLTMRSSLLSSLALDRSRHAEWHAKAAM